MAHDELEPGQEILDGEVVENRRMDGKMRVGGSITAWNAVRVRNVSMVGDTVRFEANICDQGWRVVELPGDATWAVDLTIKIET